MYGTERACHVAEAYSAAVDWVERVVREEGLAARVGFERVEGYLLGHEGSRGVARALEQELAACNRLGACAGSARSCLLLSALGWAGLS